MQYTAEITATPATGTGPYANVFHIFTGTPSTTRGNAHINALKTFFTSCASVLYCTSWSALIGRSVVVIDGNPPVYIPTTPQTVAGINGTAYCPPQTSMVVSWKTGLATRKGRGRSYMGPLSQSVLATGGNFNATHVSTVQTAATALIAAIIAIDPADYLCVYHRPPGATLPNPATDNTPILSASVANVPHVQRRRGS